MKKRITILLNSNLNCYNTDRVFCQSGLSLTPSQMLNLSEQGIPISSHLDDSNFYDGDSSNDMNIDPLRMRGVDIVDAWNLQHKSRKNILDANIKDIQNYG